MYVFHHAIADEVQFLCMQNKIALYMTIIERKRCRQASRAFLCNKLCIGLAYYIIYIKAII